MPTLLNGITPLPHLGILRVQGADAASFLHGQLTQDFVLLGEHQARLSAFCSAKGRMQASFIGFKRSPDDILLICSGDLLVPTLKRLSMFVLRAKARLSDAGAEFKLFGLAGHAIEKMADSSIPAWGKSDVQQGHLIGLPAAQGVPRALWVAEASAPAPEGDALPLALWQWLEVRSGVATLNAAVVDAFVPQMLNYESVGGVNFKKGCYPGQEVVARSQFRGTLKRRAYLVHCDADLPPGTPVFEPGDPEQPCGLVAQSAPAPEGGFDAIVSLQVSSAQSELHLGAVHGPRLTLLPLPYELLADI